MVFTFTAGPIDSTTTFTLQPGGLSEARWVPITEAAQLLHPGILHRIASCRADNHAVYVETLAEAEKERVYALT